MGRFGFIGAGNMGLPLVKGAVGLVGSSEVMFITAHPETTGKKVQSETGAALAASNVCLAGSSEILVLCVKPAYIGGVAKELAGTDLSGRTLVSVVAGVSIASLREMFPSAMQIIRVMPNTPAMVGEGMSCLAFEADENEDAAKARGKDRDSVMGLFDSIGRAEIIPESLMSAATCANGSSPAYVYMFIEALADSVVKYGIKRDMAYRLVAQTVLGSAKMVLETGEHPGKLKDDVCSPGGTTIAAVEALEREGMRAAVMAATDACFARSEELGKRK